MIHFPRTLLALVCLSATEALLPAQVPASSGGDAKGNITPHVDCTICGERSYTYPSNAPVDKDGNLSVWCGHCKRDTPHRSSTNQSPGLPAPEGKAEKGGLKLRKPPTDGPSEPAKPAQDAAPSAAAPAAPPASAPQAPGANAASFVFREVRKLRSIEDRLLDSSVESLRAMGEVGLAAARGEIAGQEAPVVLVAARVLLASTLPTDHDLVEQRLRNKPPSAAAAPLLAAFVRADPVHASPRFLVEMLDSPSGGLRTQAARELRPQLGPALLSLLEPALASKRAETRCEAIALAGAIEGAQATDALLAHLADPAPHVAMQVISELAGRKEEQLDSRLVALAFRERWVLRPQAYALLAILEREDTSAQAILDDSHIDPLLSSLASSDPFIAGTCAAALAGIGFRSARVRDAAWLDQDVVDRLVGVVSGRVFHNDFAALQAPAQRRLQLVTGQDAADGARWVQWWIAARNGFRAHRAWIQYEPAELAHLCLRVRKGDERWRLFGPEEPWPLDLGGDEQACFLTAKEVQDLAQTLEHEGVLGPQHLPGARGTRGEGESSIEVSVAGRSKGFVFGRDALEPWFERVCSAAHAVLERNRWQRFPAPGRHASVRELWQEQSAWWSEPHPELERERRLKSLVLGSLSGRRGRERARAFDELERIYALPGLADAADFRVLLDEISAGVAPARVPSLIRMAVAAARSIDPQGQRVPDGPARELVRAVAERPEVPEGSLSAVLEAAGPGFTREMLGDTRPGVRAAAARTLPHFSEPDPVPLLLLALDDKASEVQAAAIDSLGELRAEKARTELLVRARLGLKPVRAAALRAVGRLRGEYVLDALLLALSDNDPDLRLAAVEGLAELEDPAAAPFLVSLLADLSAPRLHEAARSGLLRLRERAFPELRRALVGATPAGKLEAALVLSEQCLPESVPVLLGALMTNPRDARIGGELTVLTCVDLRAQEDPAARWWDWWDGVVHDDAQAWFRAALERMQLAPPPAEALAGKGTREGLLFLVRLLAREEGWIAERARRELGRMLGHDLGPLPPQGAREAWIARIAGEAEQRRDP